MRARAILGAACLVTAVCLPADEATPEGSPDSPAVAAGSAVQEPFREHRVHVGSHTSYALALDVDGDGRPEAVVAGAGEVVVVGSDGAGGFEVRERVRAGENASDFSAGDLDGDGRADLVVANHETDHVTLVFGGPDGLAGARRERIVVGVGPHPHATAVADLDGDGHRDFLVDDRRAEALKLYRGRGDGTFVEGEPVDVGGDPYRGMAVGDLDGDGDADVVTPNPGSVAVRLNDGSGRFSAAPDLQAPGVRPFGVALGDFDGDGRLDVGAGGGEGQGTFAVWLGAGDGSFTLAPGFPVSVAEGPTRVAAADIDRDGADDFLVASWVGEGVAVVSHRPGGPRTIRMSVGGNPWGIAAADFDGDGRTDLVTANDGADEISFLLAGGAAPGGDGP